MNYGSVKNSSRYVAVPVLPRLQDLSACLHPLRLHTSPTTSNNKEGQLGSLLKIVTRGKNLNSTTHCYFESTVQERQIHQQSGGRAIKRAMLREVLIKPLQLPLSKSEREHYSFRLSCFADHTLLFMCISQDDSFLFSFPVASAPSALCLSALGYDPPPGGLWVILVSPVNAPVLHVCLCATEAEGSGSGGGLC